MAILLQIRKKSGNVWSHYRVTKNSSILISKFHARADGNTVEVTEPTGSDNLRFSYNEIAVYDDTSLGTEETFANPLALFQRLKALGYTAFSSPSEVVVADLISSDEGNSIILGGDGLLFVDLSPYVTATDIYGDNRIIPPVLYYWLSAYTFRILSVKWVEDGEIKYKFFGQNIVLDSPHGTYNRIDIVYLDTETDGLGVKKGTPASTPAEPSLLANQLRLFLVIVETGTSQPSYINNIMVYDENLQEVGGEYDTTVLGSVVSDSTIDPSNGSYHIAFNGASNGDSITFSHTGSVPAATGFLIMKLKNPFAQNFGFLVSAHNTSGDFYFLGKFLAEKSDGIDRTVTAWQEIVIPLKDTYDIDDFLIYVAKSAVTLYFDQIYIQTGNDASGVIYKYSLYLNGSNLELLENGSPVSSVLLGSGSTPLKELFTATASQTVFTLSDSPVNVEIWIDRVYQIDTIDYTYSSGTVTLATGADAGSKVVVRKFY